jgi:predicted nucleotidyltransferase
MERLGLDLLTGLQLRILRSIIRNMHKLSPSQHVLDALMPKTRQAILSALLLSTDRRWYLSELAHHLHKTPSSLQRELAALTAAEILLCQTDGNRVYYQANPACIFLHELQGLLQKTAGFIPVLRDALNPIAAQIDCAFVYGSMARGTAKYASDVDLLIIGNVENMQLIKAIKPASESLGRTINPTLFTVAELRRKVLQHNHFITSILDEAKLFVIGNDHELARFTQSPSR